MRIVDMVNSDEVLGHRRIIARCLLIAVIATGLPWVGISRAGEPEFVLDRYLGKIVYVDFWASWCTPCRASFPFMNRLQQEFGDELVIAAINLDKDHEDAKRFLSEFTVDFDIYYDPEGLLASEFKLTGMPTSYLFDREGEPLGQHVGFRLKDETKLHNAISAAVNK